MKNFLKIFLFSVIVTSCFDNHVDPTPVIVQDIEITHHNYFEVEDYMVAWNKVFDIPIDDYYLYYFSQTCSHCAQLKDWIIDLALIRGDIYFVQASDQDVIKDSIHTSIGATSYENICILGYPSVIQIKDKKVVRNVAGETAIKNLFSI